MSKVKITRVISEQPVTAPLNFYTYGGISPCPTYFDLFCNKMYNKCATNPIVKFGLNHSVVLKNGIRFTLKQQGCT